jgi:hypothetical protein
MGYDYDTLAADLNVLLEVLDVRNAVRCPHGVLRLRPTTDQDLSAPCHGANRPGSAVSQR